MTDLSQIQLLLISSILYISGLNAQNQIQVEAEIGTLSGVMLTKEKQGYSGEGYVSGFDGATDYLEVDFEIKLADLYKIEMIYVTASNSNTHCQLQIDDQLYGEVRLSRSDTFILVNAGTYPFTTGIHSLRLFFGNASVEPDFFRLTPVSELAGTPLDQPVIRVEAEAGILLGTRVEYGTLGSSGQGYVSNFDTPNSDKLRLLVQSDEAREYTLTIGYATPYGYKENYLSVNGGPNQTIQFEESSSFNTVAAGKHRLLAGLNTIEVTHFWGWFELDYIEFSQVVGLAPSAVSQGNILLHDDLADGVETVTLDGSSSSDADGHIASYLWQLRDGTIIGTEDMLNYTFPVGTDIVNLKVTDDDGNSDETQFAVIVADLEHHKNHRLSIRNGEHRLFMSGMNIAWTTGSNFAKDLINFNESTWITILDDIERAGGNAVRWWLHTNGSVSPLFGSDGKVSGLNNNEIVNIKKVLDLAYDRGILVSLCLWSFDMLQDQGQNLAFTRALLEDSLATLAYIDHALVPMVEALNHHPAVMTWEIFNEPEGMTTDFGWSDQRTTMEYVQRFVNLCAGAIHRTAPGSMVSNGSWSFQASTDSAGYDFYRDDRLIAAGGDPDGTLDFVQVHYYDHFGFDGSPFHYPASHWGLDKPIVIGEFPAGGIMGFTAEECYRYAYRLGYAGALAWSYSDTQLGGFPAARSGILNLWNDYPDDIIVPDTSTSVAIQEIPTFEHYRIFPNPLSDVLKVEIIDLAEPLIVFEIYNLQGQRVKQGLLETSDINEINLDHLPAGNYTLRLTGENKSGIQRLVKL